jgi:hypothetical protein
VGVTVRIAGEDQRAKLRAKGDDVKTTDCLVCGHTVPCPDHAPKAKKEEPYCDVCGESGADLRTPVEVCRDCYDVDRKPLIAPLVANLLTKAAAYEESVRVGGSFTKNFVEGDSLIQAAIRYGEALRAQQASYLHIPALAEAERPGKVI